MPKLTLADDSADGTWTQDTDNDAPAFSTWETFDVLIEPEEDALFWVIINDIDNASTELTVILYYSNDTFVTYNESQSMIFYIENPLDYFKFNYTFPGKPAETHYHYYYRVFDGLTYVTEPNPTFLEIEWGFIPGGNIVDAINLPKNREVMTFEIRAPTKDEIPVLAIFSTILLVVSGLLLFFVIDQKILKKRGGISNKAVTGKKNRRKNKNKKRKIRIASGKRNI